MVLTQIADYLAAQKERGLEIGAVVSGIEDVKLEEILDSTDGCAESYRCGTALYMLWKLARERDIVFDRAIDASGHGKKIIDGLGGELKHFLAKNLRGKLCYFVFSQSMLSLIIFG